MRVNAFYRQHLHSMTPKHFDHNTSTFTNTDTYTNTTTPTQSTDAYARRAASTTTDVPLLTVRPSTNQPQHHIFLAPTRKPPIDTSCSPPGAPRTPEHRLPAPVSRPKPTKVQRHPTDYSTRTSLKAPTETTKPKVFPPEELPVVAEPPGVAHR